MYGKLLGAILGGALGMLAQNGPLAMVLAAAGAAAGHAFDRLYHDSSTADPLIEPKSAAEIANEARQLFARHLCVLFLDVAHADEELLRDEVRVVREFFEKELAFNRDDLEVVRQALHGGRPDKRTLDAALAASRADLPPSDRLLLLSALYDLALVDGRLRDTERDAIRRIADGLGVSPDDHRAIVGLHLGDGQAHYERLGLAADATDDEVRSAFRRLAAVHHPDRVAHLGSGAVELASRRFRELRGAYEEIRRLRGF